MTWMGNLLDAVGKMIELDDCVTRLDASVESLTGKVSDTGDRVIRLEGLIEGALRTRTTSAERQRLPKPSADRSSSPPVRYRVRNGVVALTVKVAGETLEINGEMTNHLPAERFETFLESTRAAVEAGEFDKELANEGHGDAEVQVPKRAPGSISPEAAKLRGVNAAATRKANLEKKNKAV